MTVTSVISRSATPLVRNAHLAKLQSDISQARTKADELQNAPLPAYSAPAVEPVQLEPPRQETPLQTQPATNNGRQTPQQQRQEREEQERQERVRQERERQEEALNNRRKEAENAWIAEQEKSKQQAVAAAKQTLADLEAKAAQVGQSSAGMNVIRSSRLFPCL